MVEAGANQLPEQDIEAIDFGYEAVRELIQAQKELIAELGELVQETPPEVDTTLLNFIRDRAADSVKQILSQFEQNKKKSGCSSDAVKESIVAEIALPPEEDPPELPVPKTKKRLAHFQRRRS